MDIINFFKFIGDRFPEYSWEEVKNKRKDEGEEIPLEKEGGNMLNGKKNGVFVRYSTDWDGTDEDKKLVYMSKKLTYKDGIMNGPYVEYFSNGRVYMVGNKIDHVWDGELKYFYPSSDLKSISNYKNGIKVGKEITYYPEGTVESDVNFVHGRKEGVALAYYSNGELLSSITYVRGVPDGPYKTFYKNGDLQSMGEYNGEQMGMTQKGESFVYYPGNQLMTYVNRNTGESIEYRSDGTIKNETKVEGDKRIVIIYHENGNVASYQTLTKDKNGELISDNNWVMYDEDGNKTYENGEFLK